MDRLRVGLTGLGAVFLLTLAVSLIFGYVSDGRAPVESPKEPGEPLAQLGVAPGSEKSTSKPAPYDQLPFADAPLDGFAAPDRNRDYGVVPKKENPIQLSPAESAPAVPTTV